MLFLYYGSSTYDSKQMARLIDNIVQDCKAVGVETATPQELARLKEVEIKSIVQHDTDACFLCGEPPSYDDPLDKHHCFGGALRSKSDRCGLFVYLHHNRCHIFGRDAVHRSKSSMQQVQAAAQQAAMHTYGWSVEDFRREFYKSYI